MPSRTFRIGRALTGLSIAMVLSGCCSHPSDETMEEYFLAHQSSFERLREMLVGDEAVSAVGKPYFTGRDGQAEPEDLGLTTQRVEEYRSSLDDLGTKGFVRIVEERRGEPRDQWRVVFSFSQCGIFSHSMTTKSFLYSVDPRSPRVDDTEHFRRSGRYGVVLRPIQGSWYISYTGPG